jgi:hypothetical protein
MEVRAAERRSTRRLQFKTALHVRVWKSGPTERRAESVNLSETGAIFATDAPIAIGSVIEILLKMAEEITGNPHGVAGHVVRLQRLDTFRGNLGGGVQFDYYEILRSKTDASFRDRSTQQGNQDGYLQDKVPFLADAISQAFPSAHQAGIKWEFNRTS